MIIGSHAASHWSPLVTREVYGLHLVCMSSQKLGVTKLNVGRVLLARSLARTLELVDGVQLVPLHVVFGKLTSSLAQVFPSS